MNIKTIEGNFDNPKVNELLVNHFKELRSVSPENSCHVTPAYLDINQDRGRPKGGLLQLSRKSVKVKRNLVFHYNSGFLNKAIKLCVVTKIFQICQYPVQILLLSC